MAGAKATAEKHLSEAYESRSDSDVDSPKYETVKWYRSTWYNAIILGLCNLCAPGIWAAMNSLGGGGEESPWLVDTANALSFCLMVLTCALSGIFVKYIGIRWTLILGSAGFCPFAAGLYCNNRYQASWFVVFGAALCGLGAGIFWMAEGAIALSYPEPHNQGRFLGLWLMFRVGGQVVGGAISLGLNANKDEAGSTSYAVYQVFIALQAAAPFLGLLLTAPAKVQRTDGVSVSCAIPRSQSIRSELLSMARLFCTKRFLLLVPLIMQVNFAQGVFFTFEGLWFTVRARALASFTAGVVAMLAGCVFGTLLDRQQWSEAQRSRGAFVVLATLQGAWWTWGTTMVREFRQTQPVYDWNTPGFGQGFAWFVLMMMSFQMNFMYLYFLIGHLAKNDAEIIRLSGLLRGTESAAQAIAYGSSSVPIMGQVGGTYLNFGFFIISIFPAWLVVKEVGTKYSKAKREKSSEAKTEGITFEENVLRGNV